MFGLRLTSLFKFLVGILLLQVATALVTYIALQTDLARTGILFAVLGATLGFLVSLWFESIAGGIREQALSRMQQRHSKERERIRLKAERDKARIEAKQGRGLGGAKLKTGAAVGGLVGIGVTMMLAQFVTLGLLTISTAGGAALGYTVRSRQEKRLRAREQSSARLIYEGGAALPALEQRPGIGRDEGDAQSGRR